MRVLLAGRSDMMRHPGGDTVQLQSTLRALRQLGVDAEAAFSPTPDLHGFDVLHAFNLTNIGDTIAQLTTARRLGLACVLSTVYWNQTELQQVVATLAPAKATVKRVLASGVGTRLLNDLARCGLPRASSLLTSVHLATHQRRAVSLSHVLLPNGIAEQTLLEHDLGLEGKPFVVVPNAVASDFCDPAPVVPAAVADLPPYILSVANVSVRKNQLPLVRAAAKLRLPLVLAGRCAVDSRIERRYVESVRRELGTNGRMLGALPHDELPDLYRGAKVHALTSWFETPGLSSLEAALCGCAVVSTDRGTAREYFGDGAHYCDPASDESVLTAVERAWRSGPVPWLADHIRDNYTWQAAAEATLRGYERALAIKACEDASCSPTIVS